MLQPFDNVNNLDLSKINMYVVEAPITGSPANDVRETKLGSVIFNACLQTVNKKNRNGRMYTKEEITYGVNSEHIQDLLRQKDLCGENGHPDPEIKIPFKMINPNKVSFRINRIWWEGNRLMGEIETTLDKRGIEFKNSILQGRTPAFSMRATASFGVDASGRKVRRLRIITWDRVILPSHHDALGDISNLRYVDYGSKPVGNVNVGVHEIGKTISAVMLEPIKDKVKVESIQAFGFIKNSDGQIIGDYEEDAFSPVISDKKTYLESVSDFTNFL